MSVSAYPIAEFKAAEGSGLFAARVSAFGNEDLNGDRVLKGAFARTIDRWKKSGKRIPVIWSHGHEDPEDYIGEVDPQDVKETDDGLIVAGKMFVKESDRANKVFELMERGLISAWSFAFSTPKGGERLKDGVREISDLDLFEVGPTLIGANPEAQTIALKALGMDESAIQTKRGRRISAATAATLQGFREQLSAMQAEIDGLLEDGEGSEPTATEASAPLSEADRLRLSLAEIDAFLSARSTA